MNLVRTSQETHYVSAAKPNRLMLFKETVAVYCENRTKHRYTLWAERSIYKFSTYLTGNILRLAINPNRLMLFKETVAVYCENHTEYTNTLCGQNAEL
jgi:hypothetical protein